MDSLVLPVDYEFGEDDDVFGVNSAVRDPVLLSQRRRRVNHELLGRLVVRGRRLHLDGVVAVS